MRTFLRRRSVPIAVAVVAGAFVATTAMGAVGGPSQGKGKAHVTAAKTKAGEHSERGPRGPKGPKGDKGDKGDKGEPGQNGVSAYGFVIPGEVSLNVGPVLVTARSRNIDSVTEPAFGVFCLKPSKPIDASTRSWTVTPETSRSKVASNLMFAYADAGSTTCPAGQLAVRTYELNITKVGAVATPSEHVAFMVVIP